MIKIVVLGSGSKGNGIYFDVDGKRFLIDCGFTQIATKKRMAIFGRTVADIEGVFVTHNHKDHVSPWIIKANLVRENLEEYPYISSFPLSHDADCVGYIVKDTDGHKVAVVTDTGCIHDEVIGRLFDCDAILIETNYDVDLLSVGKYPIELLERIASEHGHLRNECAAEVVEMVACDRLKYIVALHLSGSNNNRELVRFCMNSLGTGAEVIITSQSEPTQMISLI